MQSLPPASVEARSDQAPRQASAHCLFACQRPVLLVDYINNR
jgi:hypothetical protein